MNKKLIFVAILGLCFTGCKETKEVKRELKTLNDKFSYAMGVQVVESIKTIKTEINHDYFIMGIKDSFENREFIISKKEMASIRKEIFGKERKKYIQKMRGVSKKNKLDQDKFLAENRKKDGITTTKSGLQYKIIKKGDGPIPVASDKVTVNYRGTLLNGEEFDNSYKRGKPASFMVKGVIKGWTEALQLMPVGSKYKLFIPSELAYGKKGAGAKIDPNSALIFDIELLSIKGRSSDKK